MASPITSVIIPAYKAEKYIGQAIGSCLNQTVDDLEVIVIDDASDDSTGAAVEAVQDARVRLHRNTRNSGPGPSRNRGLELASGEWITFLDADDCYAKGRLEILLGLADEFGPQHVYSDDWIGWAEEGPPPAALLEYRPTSVHAIGWPLATWLETNREARILFHRSTLRLLEVWFPETRAGQDTVFTSRLLKALKNPLVKADARTYIYRNTPGSITKSTSQLAGALELEESYRIICEEVLEGSHPAALLAQWSTDDVDLKRLKDAVRRRDLRSGLSLIARNPRLARTILLRILARIRKTASNEQSRPRQ